MQARYDAASPEERKCLDGLKVLGDPRISQFQKLAVYEVLKNRGCLK
jgi:hypothetical protein